MSSTSRTKDEVAESLSGLTLDTAKSNNQSSKPKSKKQVVDSWEDDEDSSGSEVEQHIPSMASPTVPSAPPPTPFSPNYGPGPGWRDDYEPGTASPRGGDSSKRPEKTDAVARRMIANGLGLKAPKQTEEQKAYQRSVREQERKKRELEKADEQRRRDESEKAKAAVWDD
ncbi:hypothetical protein QQS21_006158 [Conoideocrella luteorostrata]|uniref:Ubiquitin smt3 n=1 Tax=Conoideocrella luteorostrata TaxID=1105319 RepID=A0AAJ0CP49_9HYPO|nr:hypothetical protein QQS21_006158 [Conoideocrella luteorostrata]